MQNEDIGPTEAPQGTEPISNIFREVKDTVVGTSPEEEQARLGVEENDHLTRPGDEKFDRDEVAEAEKALGQG